MGVRTMRRSASLLCVAALLVLCGTADAFPTTSGIDEVVPEEEAFHGQSGLSQLIAQKSQEDNEAQQAKWRRDSGFLSPSVTGNLHTVHKADAAKTISGHDLVMSLVGESKKSSPKDDMMVGLFHNAVKDEDEKQNTNMLAKASSHSSEKIHTPPSALGTLALEPVHPAAKTAKPAQKSTTPVKKESTPKDPKLAAIDKQEEKLFKKEMQRHNPGHGITPALRVKVDSANSGAGAAADAAIAAKKAVGTLEDMKASADQMVDQAKTKVHTPSKAAVAAKIMEEARKDAAKTIKKLNKEDNEDKKTQNLLAEQQRLTAYTNHFLNMPVPDDMGPGLISKAKDEQIQHQVDKDMAIEDGNKAVVVRHLVQKAKVRADTHEEALHLLGLKA